MSRTLAVVLHALASVVAGALYFLFVLPRWWELNGDITSTWGMVLRIITGVVIGLAALPVVFTWLRTRRPEYGTPQLALRLRICSIVLHLLCAVLIIGTAISEIWLSLDSLGQWLFGIYGAAAAIGILGIFSFYLAFIAELPPPPPRPLKKKERKSRRRRGKDGDERLREEQTDEADEETAEAETSEEAEEEGVGSDDETAEAPKPSTVGEADETVEAEAPAEPAAADEAASEDEQGADEADEEAAAADTVAAETPRGRLRNRRPSGKIRRPRVLRKSDGVPVDD